MDHSYAECTSWDTPLTRSSSSSSPSASPGVPFHIILLHCYSEAKFGRRYSALGKPFAWCFTRQDLEKRLREPALQSEPITLATAA